MVVSMTEEIISRTHQRASAHAVLPFRNTVLSPLISCSPLPLFLSWIFFQSSALIIPSGCFLTLPDQITSLWDTSLVLHWYTFAFIAQILWLVLFPLFNSHKNRGCVSFVLTVYPFIPWLTAGRETQGLKNPHWLNGYIWLSMRCNSQDRRVGIWDCWSH